MDILKGCSTNSDFRMLPQIVVSFRLLLVFCGVFLSSFSLRRILSRLGIAQASLALHSLLQNLGYIARYAPSNANKNTLT